jgi:hypothetical protein
MDSSERPGVPPAEDPATLRRLRAALDQAPAGAVLSGKTAAWLHGLELEPCDPIEMIIPGKSMTGGDADLDPGDGSAGRKSYTYDREDCRFDPRPDLRRG